MVAERLSGKTIVVGVTGSIAAFKAAEIVSQLTQRGAEVQVVMTANAARFITPLTLSTLAGQAVASDMFTEVAGWELEHISMADAADLVLIAPATANIIGKITNGIADDLLTCVVMATRAPVMIAPAMNQNMLENPITEANLAKLADLGYRIIESEVGRLASGAQGKGRLASIETILARVEAELLPEPDLAGIKAVVTAGPTREAIDPVRFISNRSSGKMGYALAQVAQQRGAEVTLATGPTSLDDPEGVKMVKVETAQEMSKAVLGRAKEADVVVGAAAVVDYAPSRVSESKIKKGQGPLDLQLSTTPDILAELGKRKGRRILVGFAAETEQLVENARKKLASKHLDLIVANDVSLPGIGFGSDENAATLVFADGKVKELPRMSKQAMAGEIWDAIKGILAQRRRPSRTSQGKR